LLANHPVHAAFLEFGQRGQKDLGVAVGRYVILPDHLHFFVAIPAHVILGSWVGTLKRFVGKAVKRNNPRTQSGSAAFSITFCEVRKAIRKTGITSVRIQFEPGSWRPQMPGRTRARSQFFIMTNLQTRRSQEMPA
jgi:REP element-mobilizing transposase RayT